MSQLTISNFKAAMIAKAIKRKGVWENFGQDELRELEDKYNYNTIKYSRDPKDVKISLAISELNYWCSHFDLSQIPS